MVARTMAATARLAVEQLWHLGRRQQVDWPYMEKDREATLGTPVDPPSMFMAAVAAVARERQADLLETVPRLGRAATAIAAILSERMSGMAAAARDTGKIMILPEEKVEAVRA